MEIENGSAGLLDDITKKGLEVLQAALVLGILGDALLRATPWGLNVFLWGTVFVVGMWIVIIRHREDGASLGTISLQTALILLSGMFVWRDSVQLMALDVAAIIAMLAVLALPVMKLDLQRSGLIHYALGWMYSAVNLMIAPLFLVFDDIKWVSFTKRKNGRHFAAVFRGLLVTAPILLIFGGLFVAADAAFQELVEKTFRIDIDAVITHVMLTGLFFWITAGYFRGSSFFLFGPRKRAERNNLSISPEELNIKEDEAGEKDDSNRPFDLQDINNSLLPQSFTLGSIELSMILGLMNLLFLSFVIVQIPYLFGGMELVQNTENFKLSEYARRGFAELVWVSALVLPLLLAMHWLIRKDDKTGRRIYQILASSQIILLFVIMASAAQRLMLYTGTSGYGLTTMRFYPMVFMIWLAAVFIWFGATVLRGRRQQFAWGALWSAIVFIGVLHAFNPDDFIARTNFALMRGGRDLDTNYIRNLSDDAVPALIEETRGLTIQQKCLIQADLSKRLARSEKETDLRSWNWSRASARHRLLSIAGEFDLSDCGGAVQITDTNDVDR